MVRKPKIFLVLIIVLLAFAILVSGISTYDNPFSIKQMRADLSVKQLEIDAETFRMNHPEARREIFESMEGFN